MIKLKRRKSLLATTISSLHDDADKFANEAEESDDLNIKELLTKSNSFRATAKEKEAKFQEYVLQLKDLHKRKEL